MSDAALGATAEALASRLLSESLADRPRSRADLGRLPAPVARLLGARLDARVDRAAAPPDTPWVDPDDPRLREAARTWREAARAAAHVPAAAWEEEVDRAARLALSHLVRPAETLAAYAFETEDEPLAAALALRRIRAFAPYPYLPEIASRYVERKGLGRIDRAGLERLLRRIDRRMVSTFGADEWMTLLEPLFDLVGPLGTPEGAVPAGLLRPLFEARGAADLAAAVDGALTPDALRERIEAALPAAEPRPEADEPVSPSPSSSVSSTPPLSPSASPRPLPKGEGILGTGDDPDRAPTNAPAPTPSVTDEDETTAPLAIGSRYRAPENERDDDSEVLGPAHTVSADLEAADDASDRPGDEPEAVPDELLTPTLDAPDVPTDDASPHDLGPPEPLPDTEPELGDEDKPFDADAPVGAEPTAVLPLVGPTDLPTPTLPRFGNGMNDASDERADASEADDDNQPLWRRLVRDQGTETVHQPTNDETPLWKWFARTDEEAVPSPPPLASTLPESEMDVPPDVPLDTPLHDLERRVLGDGPEERRAWFVAELFSGSPSEYHRTLASLDEARSWTEATEIIAREVFRKHRVNIYSEPAVAFTDAVEERMSERA